MFDSSASGGGFKETPKGDYCPVTGLAIFEICQGGDSPWAEGMPLKSATTKEIAERLIDQACECSVEAPAWFWELLDETRQCCARAVKRVAGRYGVYEWKVADWAAWEDYKQHAWLLAGASFRLQGDTLYFAEIDDLDISTDERLRHCRSQGVHEHIKRKRARRR